MLKKTTWVRTRVMDLLLRTGSSTVSCGMLADSRKQYFSSCVQTEVTYLQQKRSNGTPPV